MLIPSIDLMNGKAVQLKQGKEKVLERDDVFDLFKEFSVYGEVALIDLDAALNQGNNKALIKELLNIRPCRVGGGIRDLETAQEYIKSGASKIIIGTHCRQDWVKQLPKASLIFAIDAKGDNWSTQGWQTTEEEKILDLIPELSTFCSEFLYTQVEKEGLLQGLDRPRIEQVIKTSPVPVTAAGGITTLDDMQWLSRLGANGQIGMSIYTGKLKLTDCFLSQVDFKKSELLPTVVQDIENNEVLMLAYSNRESLTQALNRRKGIYWTRSRQQIWEKGLTSGHTQDLIQADVDCDGDTILFKVKQTGHACHLDRYSCFPSTQPSFDLSVLEKKLLQRKSLLPKHSYSTKLFQSETLRNEKLKEEACELIEATDFEHARWEAADLIYFTLINTLSKGVTLKDIEQELRSRFNDH